MLFYGLIASALELVTSINKKSEKFAVVKTCVCALNFGKTHTCVRPENRSVRCACVEAENPSQLSVIKSDNKSLCLKDQIYAEFQNEHSLFSLSNQSVSKYILECNNRITFYL